MRSESCRGVLAAGLLVVSLSGCVARRLAPPPLPPVEMSRVDVRPLHLYLREFNIDGASRADTPVRVEALQDRFLDYLESVATFADVTYNLSGEAQLESPALELRVQVSLTNEVQRTYLLDALNVAFLGGWPLVPAWGDAETAVTVTVAPPGSPPIATYREIVRAPYSALFYAWYRRRYVEAAFTRALAEAFRKIASQLAADLPSPNGSLPLPRSAPPTPPTSGSDLNVTLLPEEGFRIITEAPSTLLDGSLAGYLKILGGVEVSGLLGVAKVSSAATLASGEHKEVAHGTSTEHGYRISLYSAPRSTGFFVYPVIGYLNQQIDNVDARSALSRLNTLNPANGDIKIVATDPETGREVDWTAADVYNLQMQSGYGGFRVGTNLVSGTERFETFMSLSLGLNLVEYRKLRAVTVECRTDLPSICSAKHQGWDFLKSGAIGGTLGLRVPSWRTSLRLIFDYEVYREFKYSRAINIRGPPVFSPEDNRFYEENVSMRGASLTSFVVQLALGMGF